VKHFLVNNSNHLLFIKSKFKSNFVPKILISNLKVSRNFQICKIQITKKKLNNKFFLIFFEKVQIKTLIVEKV